MPDNIRNQNITTPKYFKSIVAIENIKLFYYNLILDYIAGIIFINYKPVKNR